MPLLWDMGLKLLDGYIKTNIFHRKTRKHSLCIGDMVYEQIPIRQQTIRELWMASSHKEMNNIQLKKLVPCSDRVNLENKVSWYNAC